MSQILLYPPVAFIIFLLVGYMLFRLGEATGPKSGVGAGKISTYACGEDIPGKKVQYSYHLFHIAFFFTVLHVAALVIATVPSGGVALLGIIYLLIALITVVILLID